MLRRNTLTVSGNFKRAGSASERAAVLVVERISVVVDVHCDGDIQVGIMASRCVAGSRSGCGGGPRLVVRVQYHACSESREWFEVFTCLLSERAVVEARDAIVPRLDASRKCDRAAGVRRECATWNDSVNARVWFRSLSRSGWSVAGEQHQGVVLGRESGSCWCECVGSC
mgnify:CR=1 FL=1